MGRYELVDDMICYLSQLTSQLVVSIIIRIFVYVSLCAISHRRAHVHHLEHARKNITTIRRAPLHGQVALVVTAAQHPQEFRGRPFGRRQIGITFGVLSDGVHVSFVLRAAIALKAHLGCAALHMRRHRTDYPTSTPGVDSRTGRRCTVESVRCCCSRIYVSNRGSISHETYSGNFAQVSWQELSPIREADDFSTSSYDSD